MRKNPVLEEIDNKQTAINKESQLIQKKKKTNPLAIATSMILVISVLIGLIRILLTAL